MRTITNKNFDPLDPSSFMVLLFDKGNMTLNVPNVVPIS
jgi:hypothetical protein